MKPPFIFDTGRLPTLHPIYFMYKRSQIIAEMGSKCYALRII